MCIRDSKWVDGERREVKVRDGEAIQLANSKIDEIRGAFPEWLREHPFFNNSKEVLSFLRQAST